MTDENAPFAAGIRPEDLERAFSLFNETSQRLSAAYDDLQRQVAGLSGELAVANGELKRQYLEKEALSQRLASILAAMPAGVVVLDAEGRVSDANPAAWAMLGADRIGECWATVAEACLVPTQVEKEWSVVVQGEERRISLVRSSLGGAKGEIVVLLDITELYDMRVAFERRQRLAAMGEMAARLAHQLRTPLATALLYAAQLGKADLGQVERERFAGKTVARLRHLERLIQDMLLFVRGGVEAVESFPVAPMLEEIRQVMEPQFLERGVAFSFYDLAESTCLEGNRKALLGAVVNLLENAGQACESGGEVALTAHGGEGSFYIEVRDSGRGMDEETRERIFDPFYTTRPEGTGLGLAIVRGVAESFGGSVDVKSRLGEGSVFRLSLPPAGKDGRGI